MEKKTKGFTIVELLLAFTLMMIIIVYLFNVILGIKRLYTEDGIRTQMLIKQSGISMKIGDAIGSNTVTSINTCGQNCIRLEYESGRTNDLIWDEKDRTVSFANHKTQYIKGSIIGTPTVKIEKITTTVVDVYNSIISIHIPIRHKLLDEDFGVEVNYPYDDRVTDIPPIDLEAYIRVNLIGSIPSGTPTNQDVTLTAKPRPAEKDMLGGYTYIWERKEGTSWIKVSETKENKLVIKTNVNHEYRVMVKTVDGKSATSNIYKVLVDKIPPTCSISITGTPGENGWYKGQNATLSLNRDDGPIGSGIAAYDLTTSSLTTYNNVSSKVQGNTKGINYYGYVKDRAGNIGRCISAIKVDTEKPNLSSISFSASVTSANVGASATDAVSGVGTYYYKLDNSSVYTASSSSSYTFQSLSNHYYYATAYVKDMAGNISATRSSATACVPGGYRVPNQTYSPGSSVMYACENWYVIEDHGGSVSLVLTRPMNNSDAAVAGINTSDLSFVGTCNSSYCQIRHCAWGTKHGNNCYIGGNPATMTYNHSDPANVGYTWNQSMVRDVVEKYLTRNPVLNQAKNNGSLVNMTFTDEKGTRSGYIRIPLYEEVAYGSKNAWVNKIKATRFGWTLSYKFYGNTIDDLVKTDPCWQNNFMTILGYANTANDVYPVIRVNKK